MHEDAVGWLIVSMKMFVDRLIECMLFIVFYQLSLLVSRHETVVDWLTVFAIYILVFPAA